MRTMQRIFAALAIAALALGLAPARATVNSAVNKTIVLGNGSQTQFTFNFIGVAAAYISVIYTDAGGNETILSQGAGASQYQITLNAPVQGAVWGIGGTVTYNPSGTPISSGTTLTIFRTLPLTQAISLANQSSVQTLGKGSETGLDTGVMQSQQISENISRAIVAPIVDATPPAPLPPIAQRANQGAVFDGNGNLVAGSLPSSGAISSAMQPVVNAATLALGRTTFGLGTMSTEGIGSGLQDDGAGNARVNTGAFTSISTSQTVDATFSNRQYLVTGPANFTLDRANTLWNGFSFTVAVIGSPLTLIPNSNDQISGLSSGTNVQIPANSFATITTDGAATGKWWVNFSPGVAIAGATKSFINPVAFGAVRGLKITNNVSTPNTQIDVSADAAIMVNSGFGIAASSISFTIDLTTGTSVPAANGMDGESIPSDGDLFIWMINNGATTAGLASTSSTAPTLPAGYTFMKYIGAMKTASSILKRTLQLGNETQYKITSGSNTTVPPVMASGAASVWTPIATASFVPATATQIKGVMYSSMGVNGYLAAVPNSGYPTTNNGANASSPWSFVNSAGTSIVLSSTFQFNLESSNIYYGASSSSTDISCLGWTDSHI